MPKPSRPISTMWQKPAPELLLLLALAGPLGAAEPQPAVQLRLDAPEAYGYGVGDVIRHHWYVEVEEGYRLSGDTLPRPGSVSEWLELRSAQFEELGRSDNRRRYGVILEYQVFKGVRQTERLEIPGWSLVLHTNERVVTQPVPAWAFTLAPVLPSALRDEDIPIQPLLDAPVAARGSAHLAAAVAGVLLSLVWLAWLRRGGRAPQPFTIAWHQLRRLQRQSADDATRYEAGLRCLHRAFDGVWGRTLLVDDLPRFLECHPCYAPLASRVEAFYAASHTWFFESPGSPWARASFPFNAVVALCRDLQRTGAGQ